MAADRTRDMLTVSPSLSDQAYRALRKMITDGELAWGERITERSLGERLGVSATPVREAFRRLEHERLIERRDGRNVTVADPAATDLAKLNLIQAALRGVAARLAAESATDDELTAIKNSYQLSITQRSTVQNLTPAQRISVTREFHGLIDRAAHSEILLDMIATTTAFDLGERVRAVETLRERYPAEKGLDEHREILEALLARDGERAEQLMRAHLTRTGDFFLELRRLADNEIGATARSDNHGGANKESTGKELRG
ncbi:GntR family transcriptional regulator [Amycolatopsis sp. cmx-8-4]|uniref:GntR family transcriptional regulator n=1 Tax=Amycolatopsis sp. cmx-8-4 TaxID=2790947 RepID=UPI0039796966